MPTAKIKIIYIKLNVGEWTKALVEALEVQNRQAARAWLRTVITKVPVWTGEARGSLRPLGQFLRVAVPISPSSSKWAQKAIREGHTAEAGAAQGQFEFKVEAGRRLLFVFSSDVVHYLINEYYDVSDKIHLINEVPWYSIKAGNAAYKQYLATNLKDKIPKLKSYITRSTGEIP